MNEYCISVYNDAVEGLAWYKQVLSQAKVNGAPTYYVENLQACIRNAEVQVAMYMLIPTTSH